MKILVTNDDGVYSPGLAALADALSEIATVKVIAPDRDHSGVSNALSLNQPLRIKELPNQYVSVEGTPTDCVHLALTGLLKELPDMVVSGINHGANLGDDVLYSGTVAAAMEGRSLGFSAIAISMMTRIPTHFATATKVVQILVKKLQADPLPSNTILNVNVPDIPFDDISGFEVTRLGARHRAEPMVEEKDPRGLPIYWVGPAGSAQDAGPGTDFYAVSHNKVSITPLLLDLTHYKTFDQISSWISKGV